MRKKIRFFNQNIFEEGNVKNYETCGIACILMILDLYRREDPTKSLARQMYGSYKSDAYGRGILGSTIAYVLSKRGLTVSLMHSSAEILDNKGQYFEKKLFDSLLEEWKWYIEKCQNSAKILTGVTITCDTIKEQILCGKQVIVLSLVDGNADGMHEKVLHWIVVYGYQENKFLVCDPGKCKRSFSEEELWEYMDTPLGQICITVEEGKSLR